MPKPALTDQPKSPSKLRHYLQKSHVYHNALVLVDLLLGEDVRRILKARGRLRDKEFASAAKS